MRAETAPPDLYAVMHLDPGCTDEEIKAQWRQLARVFHPDTHPGDRWFEEEFKKIEAAYEVLGHPDRRSFYDRERQVRAPEPIQYEHVERVAPAYEPAPPAEDVIGQRSSVRVSRPTWLAAGVTVLVLGVMAVSLVRTYRSNHQQVPTGAQIIDGASLATPVYERSSDPTIRAQQDAYQARLSAVQPAVGQLIARAQATIATLRRQDQIDSQGSLTWTPPVERARDEAALTADIGQLQFRIANIEQQIDQLGTPAGGDQGSITQDLDMLESPHPPVVDDISLAERDLHAASKPL